ncbi:hypothetical protein D3C87_1674840 [compost metagenome]
MQEILIPRRIVPVRSSHGVDDPADIPAELFYEGRNVAYSVVALVNAPLTGQRERRQFQPFRPRANCVHRVWEQERVWDVPL